MEISEKSRSIISRIGPAIASGDCVISKSKVKNANPQRGEGAHVRFSGTSLRSKIGVPLWTCDQ